MGSVWLTSDKIKVEGFLGKDIKTPFYLQFVPGYVVDVVTSEKSLRKGAPFVERNLNSIIALPHITDELFARRGAASEENRYFPLLRGIVDVPAKGDPVLLCTIGNIKYYFGPLNTLNNPNWNVDNLRNHEYLHKEDQGNLLAETQLKGESPNFNKSGTKRLIKPYKDELDHPDTDSDGKGNSEGRAINDIHGDMLFEGRHGNSIRIGSRDKDPYIFISNGRDISINVEGINDGGFISITKNGSISQHFKTVEPFTLASDSKEIKPQNIRLMGDLVSAVNGGEDVQKLIYDYNSNQILQTSDRIIINSKTDSIFLSSYNNIHIGCGNNLTISTKNDLIIESKNIYLGKDAKANDEKEPMVLGQQLLNVLNELITCLSTAHFIGPAGLPMPLVDYSGFVRIAENDGLTKDGTNRKSLKSIQGQLNNILSSYHFIEKNGQSNK